MHFLLPDAERWRRVLATGAALAALALLAWWRPSLAERAAGTLVAPLTHALGALAAPLLGAVQAPLPPPPLPQGTPSLAAWERAQGQPPEFSGVAWLEVPVLAHDRAAGRLSLAAGREHGLAPELPVVFGQAWLGRIAEVGDGAAEVQLWCAPDARTGIWLHGRKTDLRAVSLGVKAGAAPVVAWIDAGSEPEAGMEVLWRPRAGDPQSLDGAFQLGILRELAQRLPKDPLWCVQGNLPPGAEGRVFVAAQAVGSELVASPPWRRAAARAWLAADAVLGPSLICAGLEQEVPATVVTQEGRVLGAVVGRRGRFAWLTRRTPQQWGEEALWLEPEAVAFTRGGRGVPRGLPLTAPPSPRAGTLLEALAPGRTGAMVQ